MESKEINDIIQLLHATEYRYIYIKNTGTSILLCKDGAIEESGQEMVSVSKQQAVEQTQVLITDESCCVIKSPIVGIYYAATSQEDGSFVKKGDKVSKGDIVCIIEALNLRNEIVSNVYGEIVQIYMCDEEVVEYGQALFAVKKS